MTTAKSKKTAPSVPHKPHLLNWLKDSSHAAAYIDAVIEESDEAGLMPALRNVVEARGGIASVAAKTGLNRKTLYRTLSKLCNPKLKGLASILEATGLRLTVTAARGVTRKAA